MRPPLPSGLVAWIAAGVLLSTAAGYLAARMGTHKHSHSHSEAHVSGTEKREKDLHAWMHDQLAITDDQRARLAPFEQAYEKDRVRLLREIDNSGEALAAAIRRGDRKAPEIKESLERINRAQAELQEKTLDHFFVMKEHLDPSQAELLVEWTHDSITRHHHE